LAEGGKLNGFYMKGEFMGKGKTIDLDKKNKVEIGFELIDTQTSKQ
jgi:hypothetical protein